MNRTTRCLLGGALVSLLVVVVGCAPATTQHSSVSRKTYTDVAAAALDSDLVALGTISEPLQQMLDTGGATDGSGIPMLVYSFAVSTSSLATSPSTITVVSVDVDKLHLDPDDAAAFKPNHQYLLFLDEQTEPDRASLKGLGTIYTPVGGNAGVFPVNNGRAKALDAEYKRIKKDDPETKPADDTLSLDPAVALELPTATS